MPKKCQQPLNPQAISFRQANIIVYLILLIYPLVGMGVDLIAPSLPAISANLQTSSSFIKNIISVYLLGYAIGNFILGFLSDAWGRRKLILAGTLIFTLISLLPTFYANEWILILVRFVQGFSISVLAVLGRAIFADVLPAEKLPAIAPLFSIMWSIGPILGPVIGGYLQYYFNWQANFYFFAAFGAINFLLLAFILPETHLHRQALKLNKLKQNFIEIISDRVFMGILIIMGTNYSLLIVFNTLGPFLIQTSLHHTSVYFGHIALWLGVVYLAGSLLCRYLLKRFPVNFVLSKGIFISLIVAFIFVTLSYFYEKNIIVLLAATLLLFFISGVVYPAAMGKNLASFRHIAGSASAVMNLVNVLITSFSAAAMSFITAATIIPMAWVYTVLLVICLLSYLFLVKLKGR